VLGGGRGEGRDPHGVDLGIRAVPCVHNAPSPKATLAIIDKPEELQIDVVIPRGENPVDESAAWESGIDVLRARRRPGSEPTSRSAEQARDTAGLPEAKAVRPSPVKAREVPAARDGKADGRGSPVPWWSAALASRRTTAARARSLFAHPGCTPSCGDHVAGDM
jgi:hypothetical protein